MTNGGTKVVATRVILSRQARRQLAWRLRHELNWPVERIGSRLGVCGTAVSHLLRREAKARSRSGDHCLPPLSRRRERFRAFSLSTEFDA